MTVFTRRDLIRMTIASTGTGSTVTLDTAVAGFKPFVSGDDGKLFRYAIVNPDGLHRETGWGEYTHSGTTFTRNVIESTNANSPISLASGAEIAVAPLASDFDDLAEKVESTPNPVAMAIAFGE